MTTKQAEELLKQASTDYAIRIGRIILNNPDSDDVYIKGVRDVLNELPEREYNILWHRYFGKKTLEEVARVFNVTRERIRQIEAKAIRRLRRPDTIAKITAVSLHLQNKRIKELEIEKEREIIEYYQGQIASGKNINGIPHMAISERSIDELDLSARPYNCLRRARKEIIGDLEKMTVNDFLKIRNLGRKAMEEIISKLNDIGIKIQE